jgi:hypothetical protein
VNNGSPIVDQEAFPRQKAIVDIREVAAHLAHPGAVWLRRNAGNVDAARAQVDDEEHGEPRQPATGPDIHRKEIRGGKDLPLGLQELGPRRLLQPIGNGLQAVFAKGPWRSCLGRPRD